MTRYATGLWLILLLLIGAGLKTALFFQVFHDDPSRMFFRDSPSYVNSARSLATNGTFAVSPERPDIPQIVRTPGYPLFLAACFACFGERFPPVVFAQIAFSLGAVAAAYLLGARLWNRRVGLVAAALLSLDVPSLVFSQFMLTETLFTLTLTLASLTGVMALQATRRVCFWLALHGGCLGFAVLIRPIAACLILLVPLLLLCVWRVRLRLTWREIAARLGAFLLPSVLLVGGWQCRNALIVGEPVISGVQGEYLYFYVGAEMLALRDGMSLDAAQQRLFAEERYAALPPETAPRRMLALENDWKRKGKALIRQYPALFAQATLRRMAKTMLIPGEFALSAYLGAPPETSGPINDFLTLPFRQFARKWAQERRGELAGFLGAAAHLGLIYIGACASRWQLGRRRRGRRAPHGLLWLILLYLLAVNGGNFRFRIPMMPLLSVYAAHGLCVCLKKSSIP